MTSFKVQVIGAWGDHKAEVALVADHLTPGYDLTGSWKRRGIEVEVSRAMAVTVVDDNEVPRRCRVAIQGSSAAGGRDGVPAGSHWTEIVVVPLMPAVRGIVLAVEAPTWRPCVVSLKREGINLFDNGARRRNGQESSPRHHHHYTDWQPLQKTHARWV